MGSDELARARARLANGRVPAPMGNVDESEEITVKMKMPSKGKMPPKAKGAVDADDMPKGKKKKGK